MTSSNNFRAASTSVDATSGSSALQNRGKWFLLAGGILFGTVGMFVEEAKQDPLTTVWFRCAFGAASLLVWSWINGTFSLLKLQGSAWRIVLVTGCLMVVMWALFFGAITRTSIAVATLVFHIQPLMTMALGAVWLRERVTRLQWTIESPRVSWRPVGLSHSVVAV